MKRQWFARIVFFFCSIYLFAEPDAYVAQVLTGGRFGEQLQGYLQAKWISFKDRIPFVYTPFSYSAQFVLDRVENRSRPLGDFHRILGVSHPLPDKSVYTCDYFQKQRGDSIFFIDIDWKHPDFRKMILELLTPLSELALISPPAHTVNIAIHVREGGGFDQIEDLAAREALALKVPPMQFYIDSLAKVLCLFPNQPLYFHLFTDARCPEAIAKQLEQSMPAGRSIHIQYRMEKNRHDMNVLEDFFSLFHFHVLIRSQSQFSLIPSLLHDFVAVCSPAGYRVEDDQVIIDQINLEVNPKLLYQCQSIPRAVRFCEF